MNFDPEKHHRKSIRLKDYDYTSSGIYFVTICVKNRQCLLGEIVNGEIILNEFGLLVKNEWEYTEKVRENIILDEYIIMPNHFHGIINIINDNRTTPRVAPTELKSTLISNSLGSILGQFKSISTKKINKLKKIHFQWQRNYYEHIVRDERALNNIRKYIIENPIKWEIDRENDKGYFNKYNFKSVKEINEFNIKNIDKK